jgi:hypothetical protein
MLSAYFGEHFLAVIFLYFAKAVFVKMRASARIGSSEECPLFVSANARPDFVGVTTVK